MRMRALYLGPYGQLTEGVEYISKERAASRESDDPATIFPSDSLLLTQGIVELLHPASRSGARISWSS
jgi:hypothetical protein